MKFASRLVLSLLCLFAVCGVLFVDTTDASAQCNAQGTAGCNAPQVSQLNLGLAQLPSAAASTSASASAVAPQAVFAPQAFVQAPAQVQYQVSASPQYVTVPSPQYVTLPQVQFRAAVTAPPQFVTVPQASASASTAASASALPLVAAQPVALNSGCANGSCGQRQGLLQRFRRPVSRSTSRSFVRS